VTCSIAMITVCGCGKRIALKVARGRFGAIAQMPVKLIDAGRQELDSAFSSCSVSELEAGP
jgi:hypothetical protein